MSKIVFVDHSTGEVWCGVRRPKQWRRVKGSTRATTGILNVRETAAEVLRREVEEELQLEESLRDKVEEAIAVRPCGDAQGRGLSKTLLAAATRGE